jgi:hypothetical protein
MLLALGLQGHLTSFALIKAYKYLRDDKESSMLSMTSVALLLGACCSTLSMLFFFFLLSCFFSFFFSSFLLSFLSLSFSFSFSFDSIIHLFFIDSLTRDACVPRGKQKPNDCPFADCPHSGYASAFINRFGYVCFCFCFVLCSFFLILKLLDFPPVVQMCALMGMGLVYAGTTNRRMAEVTQHVQFHFISLICLTMFSFFLKAVFPFHFPIISHPVGSAARDWQEADR